MDRLQLEPDDTLVLFSDGISEAEDPDRKLFEVSGLRDVLASQQGASAEDVQKAILDSVHGFTRGAHQSDDLDLLVVRYRSAE